MIAREELVEAVWRAHPDRAAAYLDDFKVSAAIVRTVIDGGIETTRVAMRGSGADYWLCLELIEGRPNPPDVRNRDGSIDRAFHPTFITEAVAREWVYE